MSDLTRYYTKEEWKKLDANVKKRILDNPTRKKARAEKGQHSISAVGSGGTQPPPSSNATIVSGSIDKEGEDRIIAAVLWGGVMVSSLMNQDRNVGKVVTHTAARGSRVGSILVGSVAGSVRSRDSSVTFGSNPSLVRD